MIQGVQIIQGGTVITDIRNEMEGGNSFGMRASTGNGVSGNKGEMAGNMKDSRTKV